MLSRWYAPEVLHVLACVEQAVDFRVHDNGPVLDPAVPAGGDQLALPVDQGGADGDASFCISRAGFAQRRLHELDHCDTPLSGDL